MEIQQIRFWVFLGIFLLMLVLEAIIQRHPTVDSKKNRLGINLALTGIDILAVRFVFGTAAVGAAQFAEERGWGLFNFIEWWGGFGSHCRYHYSGLDDLHPTCACPCNTFFLAVSCGPSFRFGFGCVVWFAISPH